MHSEQDVERVKTCSKKAVEDEWRTACYMHLIAPHLLLLLLCQSCSNTYLRIAVHMVRG